MKKLFIIMFLLIPVFAFSQKKYDIKSKKDSIQKAKEIVVTGLKYKEDIFELPMSISLIEKDALNSTRGFGIDEQFNSVPGIIAQSRAGGTDTRLTIRGFGSRGAGDRSNSGTSRGIKILIDGFPETEPDGRTAFDNLDLSIAEKVEILRSNASSLWGNAAGGVVNISTIPSKNTSSLSGDLNFGSYGLKKYGISGVKQLENGKIYGSITNTSFDGFRDHSAAERSMANLGIVTLVSPKTLLGVHLLANVNKFDIPGPLTQLQYDSAFTQANPNYLKQRERRLNRTMRLGVNLEHNIDDNNSLNFSTFLNPKFLQRSERNTYRDFTRYHIGGSANYKNNTKLSDNINNTFLVGLDNTYQDGAILFYFLTPQGERGDLKTNKREGANSFGSYFQNEMNFGESFNVLFGGRFDNITYFNQTFYDEGSPAIKTMEEKAFTHFTPKIGISYLISENNSLFVNYGGGVEVPAGNETDPAPTNGADTVYNINPLLEPIVSTTIEFGTKGRYYNENSSLNSFTYELAAFMINTTNEIIPYQGGKFYFSAGKTQRVGLELGVKLQFMDNMEITSSVSIMQSKFVEYKVDSVHYNKSKVGIYADFKNNKIPGLPYMNYFLEYKYTFLEKYKAYAAINIKGVGTYFADDANKTNVESYNILNIRFGTSNVIKLSDSYSIRPFIGINNLLDKKYAASAFINPDLDKTSKLPLYLEAGMPRNFFAGISLAWD